MASLEDKYLELKRKNEQLQLKLQQQKESAEAVQRMTDDVEKKYDEVKKTLRLEREGAGKVRKRFEDRVGRLLKVVMAIQDAGEKLDKKSSGRKRPLANDLMSFFMETKKALAMCYFKEVRVVADGDWFVLCPDRVENYLDEIKKLEVRLAESDHPAFSSVETYLQYCKDHGTSDGAIRDEFKYQGFPSLADKYGLAWIRQVYLPNL